MTAHFTLVRKFATAAAVMMLMAACTASNVSLRSTTPIPGALLAEMQAKGMQRNSPILVRVYKKESELELWKQTSGGRFALLKTYPICRWSGQLGPKKTEGDRQVPEGFYQVSQGQLNPNSQYYLSFDVGYPNNFDRQLGRAGGNIMVHGACSSRGCFAMTDNQMAEIYAVAREALQGGQVGFQVQSYPFRMTAENMVRNRRNPNIGFWQNLKEGADNFEVTKQAVKVDVCKGRYVFNGDGGRACGIAPASTSVAAAVYDKKRDDEVKMASLISSGTKAVSYMYEDGGSNPAFVARSVDQTAVPGKDRPFAYSKVQVTEVALNEAGQPATEVDADAARRVTYSAAEDLIYAEAALSRKQIKGPVDPGQVAVRQKAVYARLLGSAMPISAPKAAPVVVATAGPDGKVGADGGKPFYAAWFGLAGDDQPPVMAQATSAQAYAPLGGHEVQVPPSKPGKASARVAKGKDGRTPDRALGKPMIASTAPAVDQVASLPAAPSSPPPAQPFYKRWLPFGSVDSTGTTSPD